MKCKILKSFTTGGFLGGNPVRAFEKGTEADVPDERVPFLQSLGNLKPIEPSASPALSQPSPAPAPAPAKS